MSPIGPEVRAETRTPRKISWISSHPSWDCPESPEETHMDPKESRRDTRQIEKPDLSPDDDVTARLTVWSCRGGVGGCGGEEEA